MEYIKNKELPENPREAANCCSYLCFCWIFPVFRLARKPDYDQGDLYRPLKSHKADYLGDKLCKAWEDEVSAKKLRNQQPSLLKVIMRVYGMEFLFLGLSLFCLEIFLRVPQPQFLGALVQFFSHKTDVPALNETMSRNLTEPGKTRPLFFGLILDTLQQHYPNQFGDMFEAYFYATAVVLASAFNVMLMHPYLLSQMHLGMKMRVALCSMIYRKSLRLSKNALGETTVGQVVNLLSNDVGRLDIAIIFLHFLWVGPIETLLVTYLMYLEIGISAVFGVIFMLLFIPFQAYMGKKTSVFRLKTALRTDERVRLMNEIIQGIQVIKMYAWERPFSQMVEYARKKEINVIKYVSFIRGILLSFIMFTTRVSIFISLVAFALLGNLVTAEKAFVITAYYNILRVTMTVFFPQGVGQLAEALVSIKRIQHFMMFEEMSDKPESKFAESSSSLEENSDTDHDLTQEEMDKMQATHLSQAGVIIKNFKARWNEASTEYTLDNINLRAQPGTLVAVIGTVGAGKSSLFQAILGELPPESGSVTVNGAVSYAAQEPWLFTGTVRSNILFGQPYDRERYRQVVRKCALERDFALLPHGDRTVIGERGASLSGGQRARVGLARACYRKAAIYLLDDPLSAVDTHVSKHLFDQCLRDFLKEKTVILVTHQLQFLQYVDQIVILSNGRVEAVGSYDNLRDRGLDLVEILETAKEETGSESALNRSRSGSRRSMMGSRRSSLGSMYSLEEELMEENPMEVEEKRAEGSIGLRIYAKYFKAGGGFILFLIMFSFCILAQLLASGGDYYIQYWVSQEESGNKKAMQDETMENFNPDDDLHVTENSLVDLTRRIASSDRLIYIYTLTGIIIATVVITLIRSFVFFSLAMKASRNLHNTMFEGVTRARMYFFHTNPSGRILNRFSKDMGQVDEILPAVMIDVIQIFLQLFGIIVVIAVVNYYFIIPTVIVGIIFYFLRGYYLSASRNIKRIEATNRSPIYSHLSASLNGLTTIRSFGAQPILIKEFDKIQDNHSSAFYLFISTSRAFGFWLDMFCVLYIAVVTVSFFVFGGEGGNVGLAITQALAMTGMVQWGMRQSAELENTMTAVERVVEYETVDPEDELEATGENKPPPDWPQKGHIIFDKLSLRYFPDPTADLVLKELDFDILPQEKIGIVGRTGAGKSSIINALFRLSYNDGAIIIDQRDTNLMGLHDLRQKISIIPQEPVLFSGTMRYNLDPFGEYTDDKLWSALEEVKLKDAVRDMPGGLQGRITESGSNFSVGQRQLICLARAILRENKILVLDEATANVDPQTDALIQSTIRNRFANCTILTIAHRLHTIMDADKVMVMDAGQLVEYASPYELLNDLAGNKVFYSMAKQTGRSTFDSLCKMAAEAHEARKNK